MPAALCTICGKNVGGFLQAKAWRCPSCRKSYCDNCPPKVGSFFKKPSCPEHGMELIKG